MPKYGKTSKINLPKLEATAKGLDISPERLALLVDEPIDSNTASKRHGAMLEISVLVHTVVQRSHQIIQKYKINEEDSRRIESLRELDKYFHGRSLELLAEFLLSIEMEKKLK